MPVLSHFNVARVYGQYWEVAGYVQSFEEKCSNTGISFGPTNQRNTTAVNVTCDRGPFHAQMSGWAVPFQAAVPARLWVTLHTPPRGDYQQEFDVIMAAQNYSWVVVGHPSRQLLWVLGRSPYIPTATLVRIFNQLEAYYGYTNLRSYARCTVHDSVSVNYCVNALRTR